MDVRCLNRSADYGKIGHLTCCRTHDVKHVQIYKELGVLEVASIVILRLDVVECQ